MIVVENYSSPNISGQAYKIYSNKNFFIRKGSLVYQEAIISTRDEAENFVETNSPIPEPIASVEYVYNTFIGEYQDITQSQIFAAKPILLKALASLSDDEAYLVKFLFKKWQDDTSYEIGERILFNGELYKVIKKPENNLSPQDNSEFYSLIKKPLDLVEEWDISTRKSYSLGDQVKVGEHYYESLIEGNTWSPQEFPTAWRLVE